MKPAHLLVTALATLAPLTARAQEAGSPSAPPAPLTPLPPADAASPPASAPSATIAAPPAPSEPPSELPPRGGPLPGAAERPSEPPHATAPIVAAGGAVAESSDKAALGPGIVHVAAGLRILYPQGEAFDAFAKTTALPAFALDATVDLLHLGRFDVGAGLGWDVGTRGGGVRGLDASLTAHRFTIPIVGRWHATSWLEPFARISPGAGLLLSSVDNRSAPAQLASSSWAFVTDLSAGASILVAPHGAAAGTRRVRVWLVPELGASLSTRAHVRVSPARDDKDVLGSDAQTDLGALALTGFFWRASAAVTF